MKYGFLVLITFLFFACGNGNAAKDNGYQTSKETIAEKEQKKPLQFLSVSGDKKKNLIGQTVIRGNLHNHAVVMAYKDVRIKMLCFKQGTLTEEHEDIIDDAIQPNTSKAFKTKYRLPKGTDSVSLSIMQATAITASTKDK